MAKMEEPTVMELLDDMTGTTKRITENYRKAQRQEAAGNVALGVVVWTAIGIFVVGLGTVIGWFR